MYNIEYKPEDTAFYINGDKFALAHTSSHAIAEGEFTEATVVIEVLPVLNGDETPTEKFDKLSELRLKVDALQAFLENDDIDLEALQARGSK